MKVTKEKIYGSYVIDRSKFSGSQSDWQYDNFKFEIPENDSLYFSIKQADGSYDIQTIPINFHQQYYSHRLVLGKDTSRHHIIVDNPTLYREVWSFYYVFESEKFGNVFFTKE